MDHDTRKSEQVVQSIHEACQDVRFFYITGHGVSETTTATTASVMEMARMFFDLPFEKKIALSIRNSKAYRGYIQKGEIRTRTELLL